MRYLEITLSLAKLFCDVRIQAADSEQGLNSRKLIALPLPRRFRSTPALRRLLRLYKPNSSIKNISLMANLPPAPESAFSSQDTSTSMCTLCAWLGLEQYISFYYLPPTEEQSREYLPSVVAQYEVYHPLEPMACPTHPHHDIYCHRS